MSQLCLFGPADFGSQEVGADGVALDDCIGKQLPEVTCQGAAGEGRLHLVAPVLVGVMGGGVKDSRTNVLA